MTLLKVPKQGTHRLGNSRSGYLMDPGASGLGCALACRLERLSLGGVVVIDGEVEVKLLGPLGRGPSRWLVAVGVDSDKVDGACFHGAEAGVSALRLPA